MQGVRDTRPHVTSVYFFHQILAPKWWERTILVTLRVCLIPKSCNAKGPCVKTNSAKGQKLNSLQQGGCRVRPQQQWQSFTNRFTLDQFWFTTRQNIRKGSNDPLKLFLIAVFFWDSAIFQCPPDLFMYCLNQQICCLSSIIYLLREKASRVLGTFKTPSTSLVQPKHTTHTTWKLVRTALFTIQHSQRATIVCSFATDFFHYSISWQHHLAPFWKAILLVTWVVPGARQNKLLRPTNSWNSSFQTTFSRWFLSS